jgi:excisionase family DNA binding protein
MSTATVVNMHDLPVLLSATHIEDLTGLSKTRVYDLLAQEGCPTLRFGRSIRVWRDAFIRWLEDQSHGVDVLPRLQSRDSSE